MQLPRFSLHQASTVEDAVGVLQELPGAKLLAGGTDILVNMKHRVELPEHVVSLARLVDLRGIGYEGGSTVIGALTTLKDIQRDERLKSRFPGLVEAARSVGSYRHQTMGTLAGNLCQNTRCRFFNQPWSWRQARSICYKAGGKDCHVMNKEDVCYSTYSGDVAPALLVLDASVRVQGPEGIKEMPLADLYTGEGKSPVSLEASEIVTSVVIPEEAAEGGSRYEKHSLRGAIDFPIVGAAVWRADDRMRVAFTAVDRAPVRASELEAALDGKSLNEQVLAEAAPLGRKAATITRTSVQPGSFKRELMAGLFKRAAAALL